MGSLGFLSAGMFGYGVVALLCLQGVLGDEYRKDGFLKDLVLFGSVGLATCSAYLM